MLTQWFLLYIVINFTVADLYLQTWKKERRNKGNSKTSDVQATKHVSFDFVSFCFTYAPVKRQG